MNCLWEQGRRREIPRGIARKMAFGLAVFIRHLQIEPATASDTMLQPRNVALWRTVNLEGAPVTHYWNSGLELGAVVGARNRRAHNAPINIRPHYPPYGTQVGIGGDYSRFARELWPEGWGIWPICAMRLWRSIGVLAVFGRTREKQSGYLHWRKERTEIFSKFSDVFRGEEIYSVIFESS